MNPIREAAKRIKGHHHKGYYWDNTCENFCGLGMVSKVIADDLGLNLFSGELPPIFHTTQARAFGFMHKVAREQFPERTPTECFVSFNDNDLTTEDEVIAVMEKAAVRWDEQV